MARRRFCTGVMTRYPALLSAFHMVFAWILIDTPSYDHVSLALGQGEHLSSFVCHKKLWVCFDCFEEFLSAAYRQAVSAEALCTRGRKAIVQIRLEPELPLCYFAN